MVARPEEVVVWYMCFVRSRVVGSSYKVRSIVSYTTEIR